MSRLRLTVPAIPDEIPRALAAIGEFCEHAGIRGDVADRVRLAVREVCTNCVLHGSPEAGEATFTLDARLKGHALLIVVSDNGVGMQANQPPPGSQVELGRGLSLIAHLATGVDIISRRGSGTRVSMRFLVDPD
jgi:anti-sigma regulatory factor (Ser/Thr protein kinase)